MVLVELGRGDSRLNLAKSITKLTKMVVEKHNEKILVWLHRKNYTMKWLADKLGQTRQSVSKKLRNNDFTGPDLQIIKSLGCPL